MDKKRSCPVTLIKNGKHVTKVSYFIANRETLIVIVYKYNLF